MTMTRKEQISANNPDMDTVEAQAYTRWRDGFLADPERKALYEVEAAKSALWLQLVEARLAAGLTQQQLAERIGVSQAQIARIEKEDYDSYTLNTLRRYVAALGQGFALEVSIRTPEKPEEGTVVELPLPTP
jgi:DNA-binding XRE family transcriptional regulator